MSRFILAIAILFLQVSPVYAAGVRVTQPLNGGQYAPGSLTVTSLATAWDYEVLTYHRLFRNGVQIASASINTSLDHTLSTTITGLTAGTYQFSSSVTNSAGKTYNSAVVTITVNSAPSVSLTAPANGASYTAPANITITASASDTDGTISKVEFYNGTTLLGTDTTSPYSYTWSNVPASATSYVLKARATDNLGGVKDSATRSVTVNALPTVSLSRSPNWSSMVSPAAVTLTATASDSDGSISKVEFYNGSTLLATDTTSPYSHSLSGLTNGSYSFKAKAYDNRGASKTSATNGLTVTAPASGPLKVARRYVYDAYQQLCKIIEPETGATVMDYDAAGNVAWSASGLNLPDTNACNRTEALSSGRVVYRSYDARNRTKTLTFPDGVGDQSWEYTADGLPATVTTQNGGGNTAVNTYTYNKRRLLTEEAMSRNGYTPWYIGYSYNSNGHLSRLDYPSSLYIEYAPNALGQPTKAGTYASGVSYYPNGAIKQFTYGNGIVHTLTQNARQLPDTSRDAYGSTEFLDDGYDYDANGNVAAISDGLGTAGRGNRTMSYDGLDRLKSVVSPMYDSTGAQYKYDALDNLIRVTTGGAAARDHWYCYDSNNRLTNVKVNDCGGASVIGLGYDVQGNLNNKNGVAHTFDFGNRLRDVSGRESYWYDAYGRRVQANTPSSSYIVSQYSQSGQLLYQQDYRKKQREEYVYLGGSLIANLETPHGTSVTVAKYQHTDALGSPVAVTDASRTVLERMEYEPFGQVLAPSTPKDGPGYTGHVLDAATGLNYMQQRYYDPGIGRFLSVDPVAANPNTGASFNRYVYASNNPYKFIDPDGRSDLNLFAPTDPLYEAGKAFDIPGMFTLTGHANSTFIQGANRAQLSADQTISLAREAGLKEGHTFFVGACNVGANGGAYAQSLADKNNSLILAATGFAMFPTTAPKAGGTPYKPGDPVTLRVNSQRDGKGAPGTFAVFAPGGNGPIASGIRSVTYNPETGKAQLRMAPETGSRIGRTVSVCADKDKCGK